MKFFSLQTEILYTGRPYNHIYDRTFMAYDISSDHLKGLIGYEPSTKKISAMPNNSVIFFASHNSDYLYVRVKFSDGKHATFSARLALRFIDQTNAQTIQEGVNQFVKALDAKPQLGILNICFDRELTIGSSFHNDSLASSSYSEKVIELVEEEWFVTGQLNRELIHDAIKSFEKSYNNEREEDTIVKRTVIARLKHLLENPQDVDAFVLKLAQSTTCHGKLIGPDKDGFRPCEFSYSNIERFKEVSDQIARQMTYLPLCH